MSAPDHPGNRGDHNSHDDSSKSSTVILRALEGTPLQHDRIRDLVIAAAHALAEREGVRLMDIQAQPNAVMLQVQADQIVAVAFAAELRRVTTKWYTNKYGVETLWGEPRVADDDSDPADFWKEQ